MTINLKSTLNQWILFTILFSIIGAIYYDSVLDKGPLGAHMWRQADCLSMTRNYARGAEFLEPEMDILLADNLTTGKSAGEFPLLYYVVGKIWGITGEYHLVYRLICLLILYAGLWSLFRTVQLVFNNLFLSFILTFLLFTSPALAFYGVSFLTDAPAFSLMLIGVFWMTKYYFKRKDSALILAATFFTLSGLLKVSMLIAFLFFCGVFALEAATKIKTLGQKKFFQVNWKEMLSLGLVFVLIFSWYYYASLYNEEHDFKYTFNSTYAPWDVEPGALDGLPEGLRDFVLPIFFSKVVLFVLFFTGIVNLFLYKDLPLFAYLGNVVIIIGGAFYFVLWLPLFGVHDYYFIALLVLFPGILGPFFWFITKHHATFLKHKVFKVLSISVLIFNIGYCASVVKLHSVSNHGDHMIVGNDSFVALMRWFVGYSESDVYRWNRIQPYLEEIGVEKEDKLICLPDQSFNISLYLIDHKGWTNFKAYSSEEEIQELVDHGAAYLLIANDELMQAEFLQPFMKERVGEFEGVYVYDLSAY